MSTLTVNVRVRRFLGFYWASAGTGPRWRAACSALAGPEAAKAAAALVLGCEPGEVTLAKHKTGVFLATCSALPEGEL